MSIFRVFPLRILLVAFMAVLAFSLRNAVALNLGNLALTRVVLQQDASSADSAEHWLELGLPSAASSRSLTQLYLAQGQAAKAIEAGKQAMALQSADVIASYSLGQAYWMTGDKDSARRIWRVDGTLQPRLDYHVWLCWSLAGNGEYEQAEATLREAMDLDPEWGVAYDALASLQWGRDWQKVSWALDRAINYLPKGTAMWYWNVGRRHLMNGNWTEAAQSLRAAADLQPTEWTLRFLVLALQQSGDVAGAAKSQMDLDEFLRK